MGLLRLPGLQHVLLTLCQFWPIQGMMDTGARTALSAMACSVLIRPDAGPHGKCLPITVALSEPDVRAQLQESLEELISIKAESQFRELILPGDADGPPPTPRREEAVEQSPGASEAPPGLLRATGGGAFRDALGEGHSAPATLRSRSERSRGQLNLYTL